MKLDPKVYLSAAYLRAAEMIANGSQRYCCFAIRHAVNHKGDIWGCPYVSGFKEMFDPMDGSGHLWWDNPTPENQLARSLALCFMAEIAKEGEL